MSNYSQFKQAAARRRALMIAACVLLAFLNIVLVVGIVYVGNCMLEGRPFFSGNLLSISADKQPESVVPPTSQDETDLPGDVIPWVPEDEIVRTWNTVMTVPSTLDKEITAADARMLALPANGVVSTEYFRTSLFIGDSITQGLALYPGTGKTLAGISAVAAFKGTGPKQIVDNGTGKLPDGTAVAMWDYIAGQTPMNIYVMIGTNAMVSSSDEAIVKYYGDLLDALRVQFPNIPIYVQSILPVTASVSATHATITNDRVRLLNNAIAQIAVQRDMYYVNLHEILADENGDLAESYAWSDGMHLRPDGYGLWIDYLSRHTAYNPYNEQFLLEPYTG